MHRSKKLDRPSSSPQEKEQEDVFKTPLKSKKRRSYITPKRSIKKERFSAKRQLDPLLGQVTMNKLLSKLFYDPNHSVGYTGILPLYKAAKKIKKKDQVR